MKRLLALDLAAKTGIAIQRADGEVVTGTELFLKTLKPGARWVRFQMWLSNLCEFENPEIIIFEEPFIHMQHRTGLGISYGFKALLEMVAAQRNVRCYGIAPTQFKAFATGHGNASKEQMAVFARSMGWDLTDDNAIDARFLLFYAQDRLERVQKALAHSATGKTR